MRDLDKCQEIVTNARIALVDSQMFDYSQLVESACQGMLPEASDECTTWNTFTEFLYFSQTVQRIAPELHDAALHSLKSPSGVAEGVAPEVAYLQRMIKTLNLNEWFVEIRDLSNSDPIWARSPWLWRQL
jgi:hypothetical protein